MPCKKKMIAKIKKSFAAKKKRIYTEEMTMRKENERKSS